MPCAKACLVFAAVAACTALGRGAASWGAPLASDATQTAAAAEPFDVLEIRVLGNSALQPIDVERAVYASLGPQRTFQDLERARDALVQVYRERGYGAVFVDIPEQEVKDGLVRLQVTEGRVDRVRITGTRYFFNGRIRAALPALSPGQVLNTTQLQNQIAQLNSETPDRTVVPVLRAGRTPGTVDADLNVRDKLPLHASLDLNNRYTANTSRNRLSLNLSYNNLFQAMHSLSFQYQLAPAAPSEARVWAATYVLPLAATGHLAMYAIDTTSHVAAVDALSVIGSGRIYGLRYIVSLPAFNAYSHSFSLGADYKDFNDTVQLANGTDLTPIKYAAWVATYNANIQTPATLSSFALTPTFGVRGVFNQGDEFDFKRYHANPNFFYVRATAQHERPLVFGTRLFVRLSGQWTTQPLISNEQLSLGGVDTVRGYLEADVLGDEGGSGSIEWRAPWFAPLFGQRWSRSYFFSYFDAGYVRILEPLGSQTARSNLSSWGAGFRIVDLSGLQAAFDWAKPRQATVNTRAGESRVNFDFSYGF